jgi:uncharacterized membrane protein YdjX (TVP38/TMEM64 family)
MSKKQALVIAVVVGLVAVFFVADLGRFLTLDYLQSSRERIVVLVDAHPMVSSLVYFAAYVLVTGLSLPGAAIMTLAGGAVFGLLWGTVLVSFASSIGATIAFLVSRTLLHDWVRSRFGSYFATIDRGFEKDGNFYLFSIRMVPAFPFFVVNLLMGLTRIGVGAFYLVSQAGMLAATVVFVYAGTQLAEIRALGDVLSPQLIFALSLLGLFPLLAKKAMAAVNRRRGVQPEEAS